MTPLDDPGPTRGMTIGTARRDPNVAAWLSIVPGLGHARNGQWRRALFFLLSVPLTLVPAVLLISAGEGFGHVLLARRAFAAFLLLSFGSILVFLLLFVSGLALWASAVADARRSAQDLSVGNVPAGRWWLFRL